MNQSCLDQRLSIKSVKYDTKENYIQWEKTSCEGTWQ